MAETTQQRDASTIESDQAPAPRNGGGTAVKTRPAASRVDRLPPWTVILHNDDVNTVGHVVETIIELVKVNPRQALLYTLTAHRTGVSRLMTTHREHAELLHDQFKSRSLTVTIEPEK